MDHSRLAHLRTRPLGIEIIFLRPIVNYLSRGMMMDADERVVTAADELFAACDRTKFPNVYDVRKRAGVSMSVANRGMQIWRTRQLLSIAKPIEVAMPPAVLEAGKTALGQLWATAIEISRESLVTAQRAFDEKAAVATAHADDLVAAFETQSTELDAVRSEYESLRTTSLDAAAEHQHAIRDLQAQLTLALDQANISTALLGESQKQVNDLIGARASEQAIAKRVLDESVERRKRDDRRVVESQKREKAAIEASARYRGQWESLKAQHADLIRTLQLNAKATRQPKAAT